MERDLKLEISHMNTLLISYLFSFRVLGGWASKREVANLNYLPASDIFCRLLTRFANSLYPDQARQNVGPDRGSNCLAL